MFMSVNNLLDSTILVQALGKIMFGKIRNSMAEDITVQMLVHKYMVLECFTCGYVWKSGNSSW